MPLLQNQPLYPAKIDLSHPAFAGSSAQIICFGDQNGFLRNAGNLIAQPTTGGTLSSGTTDAGSALAFNGTNTYLDFGTANIPTVEFTFLWGGIFDDNDSPRGFIDCTNNGVSGWNIYQDGTDGMYFNNSSYPAGNQTTGWTVGQFWHGALRNKGGVSCDWFRNGTKIYTGTGVSPAAPTLPFWVGRLKVGGLPYLNARFSYLYLIDRYLSDDLIKSLQNNPWQIFESEPEILFYPVASGNAYSLTASSGSFAVTGTAATLKVGRVLAASSGSFAATGAAATLRKGFTLSASSGSVQITGSAASLKIGRVLQAGSGSVAVTGTAATLSISSNKTLQADSGSFSITGGAAALKISRVLPASAGSVQVNGAAASLKYNRLLSASPGSFGISGTDATLTYQQVGSRTLVADAGSFATTGTDAVLKLTRRLPVDSGTFAFTGSTATLRLARKVIADAGEFATTGTAATLSFSGVTELLSIVDRTAVFNPVLDFNAQFNPSKSVQTRFN